MSKKPAPKKRRDRTGGTLTKAPDWMLQALGAGGPTSSGVTINENTALNLSVVWACVRVISETVASLPWFVYREDNEGNKSRAKNHDLYGLLHDQPNPDMTAFSWKETTVHHLLLWGNGYSEIVRGANEKTEAIFPIHPSCVTVRRRSNGQIFYEVSNGSGTPTILESDQVLHTLGLGDNGIVGYSVIHKARESLGLTSAAEQMGAAFFGNGAHMGGTLEHPGKLGDVARDNLRKSVNAVHKGAANAGKFMILEEGMKFNAMGIPPNDAQFLETRQFQVEEVCRWFRVQPHKVQHLLRSTFSNIEHQSIEFVVDTVRPWLIRLEQAANWKLLRPAERGRYYTEFLVDALLRGDALSRSQALEIQLRNGVRLIDEWRAIENLNPLPDGLGKRPLATVNTIPLDMLDEYLSSKSANPDAGTKPTDATKQLQRHLDGIRESRGDAAAEAESKRLSALLLSNLDG